MKQRIVSVSGWLAVAWALLILALCATPGRFIPSAGWLELFSFDKLVHAGLFFILASLIIIAARRSDNASAAWWWLTCAALYGLVIEALQATVFVERSFEWLDAVADAGGVLLAVLLRRRIVQWSIT